MSKLSRELRELRAACAGLTMENRVNHLIILRLIGVNVTPTNAEFLTNRHALRELGGADRLGGQYQRRRSCGLRGHVHRGTQFQGRQRG